jgi:hypothetical protein
MGLNTWNSLGSWGWLLFGPLAWPLVVARPAVAGHWRRRWLGAAAAVVLGYGLYWYDGTCYGARFYHTAAPLLLVSAALGVASVESRFWRGAAMLAVAASQAIGLAVALPELRDYWGVDDRVVRLVDSWQGGEAAVLFDGAKAGFRPVEYPVTGSWRKGAIPARYLYLVALSPDPGPLWLGDLDQESVAAARAAGRQVLVWRLAWDRSQDERGRLKEQ